MIGLPAQSTVGDDAASAIVYVVVGVLAAVGVGLAALAVWVWRSTRPDAELLAPLELMDTRSWRRLDPEGRRRSLDDVRPDGAEPLRPSNAAPGFDDGFDDVPPLSDFDDLTETSDPLVIDTAIAGDVVVSGTGEPARVSDDTGPTDAPGADAFDDVWTEPDPTAPSPSSPASPASPSVATPSEATPSATTPSARRPAVRLRPRTGRAEQDAAGSDTTAAARPQPAVPQSQRPADVRDVAGFDLRPDDTDERTRRPTGLEMDDVDLDGDERDEEIPLMPGEGLLRRPRRIDERH